MYLYKQNDLYFNRNIRDNGCYYFSLYYTVAIWTDYFFLKEDLKEVYNKAVYLGYMREDCFINEPSKVLNLLFTRANSKYMGWIIGRDKRGEEIFWSLNKSKVNAVILHGKTVNNNYHFRLLHPYTGEILDPYEPEVEMKENIGARYFYIKELK